MREASAVRGAARGVPRRELAGVFASHARWRGVPWGAPPVGARLHARRVRVGVLCA